MTFGLSKKELEELEEHKSALNAAFATWTKAVERYNQRIAVAFQELNAEYGMYADSIQEVRDWARDEVAMGNRIEWDEKSERWQNSELGQSANSFIEAWELTLRESDYTEPDEPGEVEPGPNPADALGELPEEP